MGWTDESSELKQLFNILDRDMLWMELAQKREDQHPEDSLRIYQAAIEPLIQHWLLHTQSPGNLLGASRASLPAYAKQCNQA